MYGRGKPSANYLLQGAIATGASASQQPWAPPYTWQARGIVSASTGAATILIEVSDNNVDWITMGTISLTLSTTMATDGFTSGAPWPFVRANITSLSGTNATVDVWLAGMGR